MGGKSEEEENFFKTDKSMYTHRELMKILWNREIKDHFNPLWTEYINIDIFEIPIFRLCFFILYFRTKIRNASEKGALQKPYEFGIW